MYVQYSGFIGLPLEKSCAEEGIHTEVVNCMSWNFISPLPIKEVQVRNGEEKDVDSRGVNIEYFHQTIMA